MSSALDDQTLANIGWIVVHSLWQATIAWLIYVLARAVTGRASARYVAGNLCLLMFLAAQMATAFVLLTRDRLTQALATAAADLSQSSSTNDNHSQLLIQAIPHDWLGRLPDVISPYTPVLAIAWSIGVAVQVARFGGAMIILQLEVARCRSICGEVGERLRAIAARVPLRSPVRFVESMLIGAPATSGWIRPVVLLPASWLTKVPPDQLRAIVLHELAHIARRDFLGGVLRAFLASIYFFNLPIRAIISGIKQDAEEACDDLAAAAHGGKKAYVHALIDLDASRPDTALILGANGGDLRQRIVRLAASRANASSRSPSMLLGTLCAGVLALMACGFATASTVASHRALEWARSRGLTEAVVATLSVERDNPEAMDAIRKAIAEVQSGAPSDSTLDQLAGQMAHGVRSDAFLKELASASPLSLKTILPTFGCASDRRRLVEALLKRARSQSGAAQITMARAAIVLSCLDLVDRGGSATGALLLDPKFRRLLGLFGPQLRQIDLAIAVHNERTVRALAFVDDTTKPADDETLDSIAGVPSAQWILLRDARNTQPLETIHRALIRTATTHFEGSVVLLGPSKTR